MSNYPLGAGNDPNAPYNKKTKKVGYTYSISTSESIEVDENLSENEINENICEQIKARHGNVSIDFLEFD